MSSIEFLRSFRIGEYAIFDLATSFIGVFILSPLLIRLFRMAHLEIPLTSWLLFTLPIGIGTHILTGNYTPMTKYFLDPSGHYPLKIFIIILFILGFRGISIIK
ncbi:MAG: hypothetical protein ACD_40C00193G0020 [uncultured bacterium]|nr:MAG: hypothetical protein ACD_40C00193G0020 [uncultured bacterium]KKU25373.1 MAG: hypothetical protein UX37_C0025G0011 [Microgenomates group bacterium GW2011_GWA2_46_16]